jgi:hypothetical protein
LFNLVHAARSNCGAVLSIVRVIRHDLVNLPVS